MEGAFSRHERRVRAARAGCMLTLYVVRHAETHNPRDILSGVLLRRSSLLLENRHPYQGRPHAEVAKLGDRAYDPDVLGPDGETIADVRDRMARFLRRMLKKYPNGVVGVVAHADPLSALRLHLLGKQLTQPNLREEAPPLASVCVAQVDLAGEARLDWFWKPTPPPT